jgi:non-heme chloroperoxidase
MQESLEKYIKSVELPGKITLPYVEQGDPSGVPVVLLHGFAGSWRSYLLQLPLLPPTIHTLALTMRGHGEASHPPYGYTQQDFSTDLASFLKTLGIHQAIVVGHSMGAAVAQQFASTHPRRTLGLVLVSPRANMQNRPSLLELWDETISKLKDPVDPDFIRSFLEGSFTPRLPEAYFKAGMQDAQKVPARVWREAFGKALESDMLADLHEIKAPTLFIWGADDRTISQNDRQALLQTIPGATHYIYPGVGHSPHAETPERFIKDLINFIEAHTNV